MAYTGLAAVHILKDALQYVGCLPTHSFIINPTFMDIVTQVIASR